MTEIRRSRRSVPRSDDLDDWLTNYGGTIVGGSCDALIYPEDVAFWSDEEREAWREEIAARMERKRPAGFQADWESI